MNKPYIFKCRDNGKWILITNVWRSYTTWEEAIKVLKYMYKYGYFTGNKTI